MKEILTGLVGIDWVYRYCWFDDSDSSRPPLASSRLFDEEGNALAVEGVSSSTKIGKNITMGQITDAIEGMRHHRAYLKCCISALEAISSNISKKRFFQIVNKAKQYIKKGDIFQVVLSQRFESKLTKKPIEIYKKLRVTNPSPFMFFFNFNDFQIIGASPEILVRLRNNVITVRPIAGTRPRGRNNKEDNLLKKDLINDKKELSEHLMLLDLGRNDAGKVSKINTVKVTERFKIEKYSHVMHIVSNVTGVYDKKFSKFEALMAGFPAGTVSGAPKIRAMEIIDELEKNSRKIYAGGIGYFSANGDFDTCIALRTAVTKNNKFYVQAGAGIVADSKPINEYNETINKAKALIKSLEK